MSIRVMTWVWEHSWVKGSELLLLLAIADHTDDDGCNAWPSIARLAARTRVDRRTVQRLLRRLALQDCIVIEPQSGQRGTNRYTVVTATPHDSGRVVDNLPRPVDGSSVSGDKSGGGTMPPRGTPVSRGRQSGRPGAAPAPPEPSIRNGEPSGHPGLGLVVEPLAPSHRHDDGHGDGGGDVSNLERDARVVLAELGPDWPLTPREVDQLLPQTRILLTAGWTVPRLAATLSGGAAGVRLPAAVLHARLRELGESVRQRRAPRAPEVSGRPPWCGDPTCDERTRMRDDDTGPVRRCPECHPRRSGQRGHDDTSR